MPSTLDTFLLTSDEYVKKAIKEAKDKIREAKGREATEKEVEDYLLTG